MKIRSKLILSAVAATLGCALLAGCGGAASSSTASSASPAASSVVLSQAESALPDDGTNSPDALADEVDALLDQASVETDQAKRAALVEQVDQIARDEAAYIPLFFKENIFGVRAGIQYTPSCDDHILAWDFTF